MREERESLEKVVTSFVMETMTEADKKDPATITAVAELISAYKTLISM